VGILFKYLSIGPERGMVSLLVGYAENNALEPDLACLNRETSRSNG